MHGYNLANAKTTTSFYMSCVLSYAQTGQENSISKTICLPSTIKLKTFCEVQSKQFKEFYLTCKWVRLFFLSICRLLCSHIITISTSLLTSIIINFELGSKAFYIHIPRYSIQSHRHIQGKHSVHTSSQIHSLLPPLTCNNLTRYM